MPGPITGTINRRIETGSDYPASVAIATTGDVNAGTRKFCGAAICGSAIASVDEGRIAAVNGIKSRARGLFLRRR